MKERLMRSVSDIKKIVSKELGVSKQGDAGLLTSFGGHCLFLFYYAKYFEDNDAEDLAFNSLEKALSNLARNDFSDSFTFCNGISGFGWLLNHLRRNDFADIEESILIKIDEILTPQMFRELNVGNHDYLHGAIGMFLYFIDRLDYNANSTILKQFISQLDMDKKYFEKGIYWDFYSPVEATKSIGVANIGLSHGLPAILGIISKYFLRSGDASAKILIEELSLFLLSIKNRDSSLSIYPYSFETNTKESSTSRLGWCYGDLGVALSLIHAGNAIDNVRLKEEAFHIASHAIKRKDLKENGIVDAGLCHGTAGIAQIFKRIYFDSNDSSFLKASDYWFEKTLPMIQPQKNLMTGYCKWDSKIGYVNCFGLLEGISGVGLSLLSALSDEPLNWDESLLIS